MARSMKARTTTVEEKVDRLSDLPDGIIHKILSLVDLKYAIQTCVLSRRWRFLWASVPDLNFKGYPPVFTNDTSFHNFMHKVLSTRRNDCCVRRLVYYCFYWYLPPSLFDALIQYAVTHHVEDLRVQNSGFPSLPFPPSLFTCKSLKYLHMTHFGSKAMPESFGSGLTNLTSLVLYSCVLGSGADFSDPFSTCPNLKNLYIGYSRVSSSKVFKISGTRMVNLTIRGLGFVYSMMTVEIFAPKLARFCYQVCNPVDFSALHLPSLNYVDVQVRPPFPHHMERGNRYLINMFRGLYNAECLRLSLTTIEVLNFVPGLLEQQPSPFQGLKSLKVHCMPADSFIVPTNVMNYLLRGTPSAERVRVDYLEQRVSYLGNSGALDHEETTAL